MEGSKGGSLEWWNLGWDASSKLTVLGGETRARRMGGAVTVMRVQLPRSLPCWSEGGALSKPWKGLSEGNEVCIDFGSGRAQFAEVNSERFCTYPVTSNQRSWTKWLCSPQNQSQGWMICNFGPVAHPFWNFSCLPSELLRFLCSNSY